MAKLKKIRTNTAVIARGASIFKRAIRESLLESAYTNTNRAEAVAFFGGCAFCGDTEANRNDHLVPVSQGGEFVPQNVVPACQPCDDSKGGSNYIDWMRNGKSARSLLVRKNFSDAEIEERIKRIRQWAGPYSPRSEAVLLGGALAGIPGSFEKSR